MSVGHKKRQNQEVLVLVILFVVIVAMWGPSVFAMGFEGWPQLCF